MAQSWYLMTSPYQQISGFESEEWTDFSADAFSEALETPLAYDVEICNYDLSVRKPIKVVMQGNTQDTRLKTTNRQMLAPYGSCEAGNLVYYKDRYWLVIGLVDDASGMYDKAVLTLCNYLLEWINDKGEIIQRWASVTSASQYNNGETGFRFYFTRTDQLMVMTPNDEECLLLYQGKRFVIDSRTKIYEKNFGEDVTTNFEKPILTYQLTRPDTVLYDYEDSGFFEFMATQDEKHERDGYVAIDGQGYWLCDIKDNIFEISADKPLSCEIQYEEATVYCGLEPTVFYAKFFDENGNEVSGVTPAWEIATDFSDDLEIDYVENAITISTDKKSLISHAFELKLSAEGYEEVSVKVLVDAFI